MKKITTILIITILIILSILVSYNIYSKNQIKVAEEENEITEIAEVIEDDCTDEYEYEQGSASLTANSEEEKISPNAVITYKKIYNGCNHEVIEQKSVNSDLVNKTKSEFEQEYEGWNIEEFSPNKIIISKKFEGNCGEEFILRDKDGIIIIYKINDNNEEEEYEVTDISTDYLAEPDKVNMKNGLKIIGKQELNKIIEDFE